MKYIAVFWLIFGIAVVARAQQPTPALPAGPLLNPMPDRTKWTIVGPGAPGKLTKSGRKSRGTVNGTRVGDIVHIVEVFNNGSHWDTWNDGHVQVVINPEWKEPNVTNTKFEPDFKELTWVSAKNFIGIKKVPGHGDCMCFEDKILPAGIANLSKADVAYAVRDGANIESMKSPVSACIEVASRLPVTVQIDDELLTYKFESLPDGFTLTIPPQVQVVIKEQVDKADANSRVPVQP